MKILRIIMVVLLLFVVGSPAASAGYGPMNKPVPIKGTGNGSDTISPFDPGCVYDFAPEGWFTYRFTTKGTGNVAHLGKVDFVLDNCSALNLDYTEGVIGYGTITFTAANGDVLVIAHKGTTKATSPTDFTAQYTWEVVGDEGTGRFDGATGKGTSIGLTSVPDQMSKITLRGMIAYDASNRSTR
ncbi:MAG: hypothetical protein MUF09_09535 [Candidatus Nanopelagicales bacterium]|nr:hypothetical protein [Candidatus Nanopelagicales bacterium]